MTWLRFPTNPLRRSAVAGVAAVAAVVAVAGLAGCSGSGSGNGGPASLVAVSQRYGAAVDPAHSVLTATVSKALSYSDTGGSTASLDSTVPPTVNALRRASSQLGGIAAPTTIRNDILDVAKAMNIVITDLNAMSAARDADVQPAIALVVADSGRESAADNLVRLALAEPTAAPAAPAIPVVVETTTVPDTTTTSTTLPVRATPTTAAHTATTARTTTTAVARTTTTRALTTTTLKTP